VSTGFRTEGEVTIADLVGDIAGKGALDLNRKLNEMLDKTGSAGQVLVNLERCLGLDLVALRVLANASKELVHRRHGSFGMVKVSATIREQLISAALLHRFEIFDDEEEGVRQFSNRRWAFENMTGHTIVCGYGRFGSHVVRELRQAGVECVVVDADPDKVAMARDLDCPAVEGDCTQENILKQAGIEQARRLAPALSSDTDNLLVTYAARSLNPDLAIVARANEDDAIRKLQEAGANGVVSLYRISAQHIAMTLLGRDEAADG
jgi:voltage-gated potassium channel Kch